MINTVKLPFQTSILFRSNGHVGHGEAGAAAAAVVGLRVVGDLEAFPNELYFIVQGGVVYFVEDLFAGDYVVIEDVVFFEIDFFGDVELVFEADAAAGVYREAEVLVGVELFLELFFRFWGDLEGEYERVRFSFFFFVI